MRGFFSLEEWCHQNGADQILRQWDWKENKFGPADIHYHSSKPCHWVCEKEPEHKWVAPPERRTKHRSTRCPYCSGRFLIPEVNSFAARYPALAEQFDSERNGITPDRIFSQSNRRCWWRCTNGHSWLATPNSRVRETGACPYCVHRHASPEYNLQTQFPRIAEEWVYEKNEGKPTDYLPYSGKMMWWKCRFHPDDIWRSAIGSRTAGRWSNCPICRRERNLSFPEQAVYYYLKLLFPDAENRRIIHGKEVDVFLPSLGLAVEYDGYYYHTSEETRKKEEVKDRILGEAGIQVLRIKEHQAGQTTPPSEKILWYPIPPDYNKYLFIEDLMRKLIGLLNKRYDLRLVTRPDIRRDSQMILSQYISRQKGNSLARVAPQVAAQWHPARNGSITPELVPGTSNKKYWWMCLKGHEWEATVSHRVRGGGCPYCAGKKVSRESSLANRDPELAKWWHPTKNGDLTPWHVMPYSRKTAWWQCKKGHEWQMQVCDGSQGARCPYCSHHWVSEENALSAIRPELAAEWNYGKNPSEQNPDTVAYSSGKKFWWICRQGHEWQERVCNRSHLGLQCPFCSGRRATTQSNLAVLHPEVAAEWHPEKNGEWKPEQFRPKSNRKVWWRCARGHEWEAQISSRTAGTNCPYCSGRLATRETSLAGARPDLALEWHPTKNLPLAAHDLTLKSTRKVWWKCLRGHEWRMDIRTRAGGLGNCPYCMGKQVCAENALSTLSPRIAREWHREKNGALTPEQVTGHSGARAWWKCGKCGKQWQARIIDRTRGGHGCPHCLRDTQSG